MLPRWLRVGDAIDFVGGVHPRFSREKCMSFLDRTKIKLTQRVRELSKGMVTQLHLALVMAIDATLLVLDEPTLGLDILYRKEFYQSLLNDYFDEQKTILVTTHQVEEVEHILSDLIFIKDGRIVLDASMDAVAERYAEVMVNPDKADAARALKPLSERQVFGKSIFLFDGVEHARLAELGELHKPSVAGYRSSLPMKRNLRMNHCPEFEINHVHEHLYRGWSNANTGSTAAVSSGRLSSPLW